MFEQLISTFEMVDEAIIACDAEAAETVLTHALLRLGELYRDNDQVMQKVFPTLEAIRKEIQRQNFIEARALNSIILGKFRDAQKIEAASSTPKTSSPGDTRDNTNLSNTATPMVRTIPETKLTGAAKHLTEHEEAWAQEREALHNWLRSSGLTVVSKTSMEDPPPLVVTFPPRRRPKRE